PTDYQPERSCMSRAVRSSAGRSVLSMTEYTRRVEITADVRCRDVRDGRGVRRRSLGCGLPYPAGPWRARARAVGPQLGPRHPRAWRALDRRTPSGPSPQSLTTLISLWTLFTWAVERAIDTALSAARWVLTLPLSHTTPSLSVLT